MEKTIGIAAAALGILYGSAFAAPANAVNDRLEQYADYVAERREKDFGYPINHDIRMVDRIPVVH